MARSASRSKYRPPADGRTNSTSLAPQKPADRKVTLDDMQVMAGNGTLEEFLDVLGIPAAPAIGGKSVKRRMGEGPSFDREKFNQVDYEKRLSEESKD